jgi:periplasmic protein TonB
MALEPTGVPEEVIGSLKSCFVEGDPEQQRRERKIRRRALVISIILQTVAVAALVVFPLLGKSERVTYEPRILPPYAPGGPVKPHTGNAKPHDGGRRICIVCVDLRNPLRPLKPGEAVNTTLNQPQGDSIPGLPPGPGVPGSLNLDPRIPEPPGKESGPESPKRLKVTSLEPAMLTHRVEPVYPILAKQTGREGRVELHALIATDGTVQSLEVLSGDPLFYNSALAAVREWRYRPTYLNGQAVEIDTRITVVYKLNR